MPNTLSNTSLQIRLIKQNSRNYTKNILLMGRRGDLSTIIESYISNVKDRINEIIINEDIIKAALNDMTHFHNFDNFIKLCEGIMFVRLWKYFISVINKYNNTNNTNDRNDEISPFDFNMLNRNYKVTEVTTTAKYDDKILDLDNISAYFNAEFSNDIKLNIQNNWRNLLIQLYTCNLLKNNEPLLSSVTNDDYTESFYSIINYYVVNNKNDKRIMYRSSLSRVENVDNNDENSHNYDDRVVTYNFGGKTLSNMMNKLIRIPGIPNVFIMPNNRIITFIGQTYNKQLEIQWKEIIILLKNNSLFNIFFCGVNFTQENILKSLNNIIICISYYLQHIITIWKESPICNFELYSSNISDYIFSYIIINLFLCCVSSAIRTNNEKASFTFNEFPKSINTLFFTDITKNINNHGKKLLIKWDDERVLYYLSVTPCLTESVQHYQFPLESIYNNIVNMLINFTKWVLNKNNEEKRNSNIINNLFIWNFYENIIKKINNDKYKIIFDNVISLLFILLCCNNIEDANLTTISNIIKKFIIDNDKSKNNKNNFDDYLNKNLNIFVYKIIQSNSYYLHNIIKNIKYFFTNVWFFDNQLNDNLYVQITQELKRTLN